MMGQDTDVAEQIINDKTRTVFFLYYFLRSYYVSWKKHNSDKQFD
jgi:hypothetical protein